ncbi:hypothetical protein FACS1894170_09110 [Planctomycetales bacterium]|nr:hypothetical protein FACS1894170_09110 [Planctomycetales bacterium]
MKILPLSSILFLCFLSCQLLNAQEKSNTSPVHSPFGICAHLQGGEEYDQMPKNLELMRKAGIRWVRTDFRWVGVENPQGNWHFENLDRILDETEKCGIQVLPILNDAAPWATPVYQHLDAWLVYVEKVVNRYKDKIKYWEVWNEPNGTIQGSGADYKILLEATYKKIKSIDPNLIVLYGGTAEIPFDYIEDSLKAGAADFFDEFNIHPYRSGMTSVQAAERYYNDLEKLHELLAKYDAGTKPVWITELGWATPPANNPVNTAIFKRTKQVLEPSGKEWTIAVLIDSHYPFGSQFLQTNSVEAVQKYFPAGYNAKIITLNELKNISPSKYDALFLPPSECYPAPFIDDIVNYVTKGGKLFLFGGVPLFYKTAYSKEQPGVLEQVLGQNTDSDREKLRICWTAWWTDPSKKTPNIAPLTVAEEMKPLLDDAARWSEPAHRFLNAQLLQDGDKLIPLLYGQKDDFKEPCAGIFQFNSDMKGAVIVSTMLIIGQDSITTEDDQGIFLTQSYLLSLRFGMKRYFWYEFQAPEGDNFSNQNHFGIVHQQLQPKPAYIAYSTLTGLFTDGSVMDTKTEWKRNGFIVVHWKQKDGTDVWAVWSPSGERQLAVKIGAGFQSAKNYLGETLPVKQSDATLPLDSGAVYLIGAKTLEF